MIIFFVLVAVINVHFYSVAYTHWKNHGNDHADDIELRRLEDETTTKDNDTNV